MLRTEDVSYRKNPMNLIVWFERNIEESSRSVKSGRDQSDELGSEVCETEVLYPRFPCVCVCVCI